MAIPSAPVEAEEIPCPRCGDGYAARAPREGLFERLASVFYYYPFRCQLCRHRFRKMNWGVRYERSERRQFERLQTEMPVRITWGDQEYGGIVSDLSISGARIQTDEPIPAGQAVQLHFRSSTADVEVTVDVSMVRSVRDGEVGLQFTRLSNDQEKRLALLVRDLLQRMKET